MKKRNLIIILSVVGALAVTGTTLGIVLGTKGKKKETTGDATYAFSIGLRSRANAIEVGSSTAQYIDVYDNGVDTSGRSYYYSSTDDDIATIDSNGKITAKAPGRVNFVVTEGNSGMQKALKREIVVYEHAETSKGGYNYSGGTSDEDLTRRAEVLGHLEKYVMDSHLTGITLFENGGLVKYADRVKIPTAGKAYIDGYGFGILTDGELEGNLPGEATSPTHPDYYHSSISQDSLKINQYSATGSQVSDLASYITSSYWSTKLNAMKNDYEWFPSLATDEVKVPLFNADGFVASYAAEKSANSAPIPAEPLNSAQLYKKWRIYVKTDGVNGETLKYTTASADLISKNFNNRGVTIDDYEFIYQLLFTGSNNIIRGTEMANDTSYGIKGAQRYFNETKSLEDGAAIQAKWDEFIDSGKLGIKKGSDINGAYLDIELINAIDSFTAMYTLSSSLTSPLPRDLFVGAKAIDTTSMKKSIKIYGTFNNGNDDKILDYTLCLGAYTLAGWKKNQEIVFSRNDGWFEKARYDRYKIPGVYIRVIDTSTDTEKNWKQFNAGNLDSAGVPTSKVQDMRGTPNVYETKGDATFKLNVNSCTQEEWDAKFGENGTIAPRGKWDVKPWMSNSDFLDGLFYSIDREAFATKRGVAPSTNYFSNAYQNRNEKGGTSYNQTEAHKDAVSGYSDDNGYNLDKAIDCFRNAVKQLSDEGKLTLGSDKDHPSVINIHIRWMYETDIKEYGEDIKFYFEKAFNDPSVCNSRVKLEVKQEAVKNWEDVYNEWMMKGQFDLGFGAISGNTYNPLNFMEVLKSDNSSSFTLNWGPDTSKVDEKNPIIYAGQKWSFDALWEVADHGGIVENGEKVKPVKYCYAKRPTEIGGEKFTGNLYEGFDLDLPVSFASFDEGEGDEGKAIFDVNRIDCYVFGRGNITLAEKGAGLTYDKENGVIHISVAPEIGKSIDDAIKDVLGIDKDTTYSGKEEWKNHPFTLNQLGQLFDYELYYELTIMGGSTSINYFAVERAPE